MSKMKPVSLALHSVEYTHRTDYIHTLTDPRSQATYSLISASRFYPLVVVTGFGNIIGFDTFRDMRKKFGNDSTHIKLIGYAKSRS